MMNYERAVHIGHIRMSKTTYDTPIAHFSFLIVMNYERAVHIGHVRMSKTTYDTPIAHFSFLIVHF